MKSSTTITGELYRSSQYTPLPKRIWAYWSSDNPPELVSACMSSWTKFNPDYDVVLVTPDNIARYVDAVPDNFAAQSPQRQSDWARLALLAAHGGIYMDATMVVSGDISFISDLLDADQAEAFGYYLNRWTRDSSRPVIESWMLAARPNSAFMNDWKNEFEHAIRLGAKGYVRSLKSEGNFGLLRQGISAPEYLNIHLSAQKMLMRAHGYRVAMLKAEAGPYSIHHYFGWRRHRIRHALCDLDASTLPQSAVTKLRGWEWRAIVSRVNNPKRAVPECSFVGKLLRK